MRRKVLLIALTLSLNIFALNIAEAEKPQYCNDAFWSCVDKCADLFSWLPLAHAGCVIGCGIGWERCGDSS